MSDPSAPGVPFPGLRPFQMDETHLFFGREEQTDELLERLERSHFLAVIGASGCGKSSLVRAGLLNGLQTGFMASAGSRWRFATMQPGDRPIANLAQAIAGATIDGEGAATAQAPFIGAALRRGPLSLVELLDNRPLPDGDNLLLLVDQFEEIFRFRAEGGLDESEAFVALLLEAARAGEEGRVPIFVVITMRSDFLGDCALFQDLPEAINVGQCLTPRMTREQKVEAIRGPSRVFGGDVEPELLNTLLNDVGPDPDQLPLMQHLLARMWDMSAAGDTPHEAGPRLGLNDYRAAGELKGALSLHAEEAFAELTPPQRRMVEYLFRGLSERTLSGQDVRRPAPLGELAGTAGVTVEEMIPVVEVFRAPGRSFIMPGTHVPLTADTVLDISHESLLRQWERVHAWVEEEAASAETYRRLAETAVLWRSGQAGLWGSPNLDWALEWKKTQDPSPLWAARYFHRIAGTRGEIDADETFALSLEFLAASEVEQARHRNRERWRLIGAYVAAGALLLAVFGVGKSRWDTIVLRRSTQATLSAHEVLLSQPEVALWLTLYAYHLEPDNPRNAQHLYEALGNFVHPARWTLPSVPSAGIEHGVQGLGYDTKGENLVTTRGRELWNWRLGQGGSDGEMIFSDSAVFTSAAYGSNGVVVAGDAAGRTFLVNVPEKSAGELELPADSTQDPDTVAGEVAAVAFSPDGRFFAVAKNTRVRVWELVGGEARLRRTLPGHRDAVLSLAFGRYGTRGLGLATGSADGRVLLWDLAHLVDPSEAELSSVEVVGNKPDFVRALAFGERADTTYLAYGNDRGHVGVYQIGPDIGPDFSLVRVDTVSVARVRSLAFSPAGDQLAAATEDQSAYLLGAPTDTSSLHSIQALSGHLGFVTSVAFSPDGRYLASGSMDGTAKIWAADQRTLLAIEKRMLAGDRPHTADVRGIGFSPPPRTIVATASNDGHVALWDYGVPDSVPTLKAKAKIPAFDTLTVARGVSVAFSHDGKRLAVASLEGNVATVWNVEKDTLTSPVDTLPHPNWVWDVEYSPDDSLLATAGADGVARIYRVRGDTYTLVDSLAGHNGKFAMDVTFSPDFSTATGGRIATAGRDHSAVVWKLGSGGTSHELVMRVKHDADVRGAAFSPDGRILATAGDDQLVRLWSASTGDSIGYLRHGDVVWSLAFSRDGKRLATSSYDGFVRIFDAEGDSFRELLAIEVKELSGDPDSRLGRVAFSPSQDIVGVGSWDDHGYLYAFNPADVARNSWKLLTRTLMDDECRDYLPATKCYAFLRGAYTDRARQGAPFRRVHAVDPLGDVR